MRVKPSHLASHTRRPHQCSCGVIAYGNGGASSHFMMHRRRGDGHREVFVSNKVVDPKQISIRSEDP